jgi:hypothetical protein
MERANTRPGRAWTPVLACLVHSACTPAFGVHHSFRKIFEESRYVAVVPAHVEVWQGDRTEDEWNERGYRNLTQGLQAELEKLGLVVVWVVPDEETGPCLATVTRSYGSLVPELETPWTGAPWEQPVPIVERAGLLLDASGGDILLLVQGLDERTYSQISLRMGWVGRNGRVLWHSRTEGFGSLLLPDAAAATVAKSIEQLPRVRSPRSAFIESEADDAARADRQARARAVLAAEVAEAERAVGR